MLKRKALDEAFSAAEHLLDSLNRREIVAACKYRDLILFNPPSTPEMWVTGDEARVAQVLYAIAQILSRYCLHSNDHHGRQCQFKRLDKLLELNHGSEMSASSRLLTCSLATAAKFTFYYATSALHKRNYEAAYQYFDDVRRDAIRLRDDDLQANAHFYLSTCARKHRGESENAALNHLAKAKECLRRIKPLPFKRITVVNIHMAWETFGQGNFDRAAAVARSTLRNFGSDYATKAYAQLLLARIARRENDYVAAERRNKEAIKNFEKRESRHRALARAHANLAHTHILLALKLKGKEQAIRLEEARTHLKDAARIYSFRHYLPETSPEVRNLQALIEYCEGRFGEAIRQTDDIYMKAVQRKDCVEMSTARIIQCMSFLRLADGVDTPNEDAAKNFLAAFTCAQDAVRTAALEGPERHPRRQARAHIWLGRTYLTPAYFSLQEATRHLKEATRLMPPPQSAAGYIGEELGALAKEIQTIETSEKRGVTTATDDTIYRTTAALVLSNNWTSIKQGFEERVVKAWFDSGLRADEIRERTGIKKELLTRIKKRCVDKKLLSEVRLAARRGRGHRTKAEDAA